MKSGDLLVYDARSINRSESRYNGENKRPLRAVQWNVERNIEHAAIIQTLKRLDADIIMLQEVDIHCERSDDLDHFRMLCDALGMRGGYVVEFEELHSPLRKPRDQVRRLLFLKRNCDVGWWCTW